MNKLLLVLSLGLLVPLAQAAAIKIVNQTDNTLTIAWWRGGKDFLGKESQTYSTNSEGFHILSEDQTTFNCPYTPVYDGNTYTFKKAKKRHKTFDAGYVIVSTPKANPENEQIYCLNYHSYTP